MGVRVPSEYDVKVSARPDENLRMLDVIKAAFAPGRARIIQRGVFFYCWVVPEELPAASWWLLVFFDALPFLGSVIPGASISDPQAG